MKPEKDLSLLFIRASRKNKLLTQEERKLDGARKFKQKALGIIKTKTVKTIEEIGELLYKTGITSSPEEGKELVPYLVGGMAKYGLCRYLGFERIDEKRIKIGIYEPFD